MFDLHDRLAEGPLVYQSGQQFPPRASRIKLALTQHGPSHLSVSPDAIHVYICCLPFISKLHAGKTVLALPKPKSAVGLGYEWNKSEWILGQARNARRTRVAL
jgi:hypothetical protein